MGAWLEKYSMDWDGRSPVGPCSGGGEANVLPETLGQEHTKMHIYVLPVVCWVPVVFGVGARRGAALGVVGVVGKAQPHLCGRTCWAGADEQTGLGWQGGHLLMLAPAMSWELKCCCSTKGLLAPAVAAIGAALTF